MKTWFLCTLKYQIQNEEGKVEKKTESYLVDAVSFTEAEARIYQELGSILKGDFVITNLSKSNFSEIFYFEDSSKWYKCKVSFIAIDEKSKKEKKINQYMLVTAENIKEAYQRIEDNLGTMLVPIQIVSIAESSLIEVFPYIPENEKIPDNLIPLRKAEAEIEEN
ncbi:MAG: DUF4494 domain-containing protein [Cytophagales bacterium]|nr:MAG: DUF4494 domain-containing protein [Cytophagales bacterium]